ncbi:MAG: glycosyltransferase family 87 protein [Silvibacterium sp.]
MRKIRTESLLLWLLGGLIFVLGGYGARRTSLVPMLDFKPIYYGARCLLEHGNPYNQSELQRVYLSESTEALSAPPALRPRLLRIATVYVYPPTILFLTVPIALLGWGAACFLWLTLIAASILCASFLMLRIAGHDAPVLTACLIGFFVATSILLLEVGNPAGLSVGLCVIAVWCFAQERFAVAGVLCLAASLAIKPQDTGLVWLFFLLAGGVYRRRAWQSLGAAVALSLPGLVWAWRAAPNWLYALRTRLTMDAARGSFNDPGPTGVHARAIGATMVNLQTLVSLVWDNPRFYNAVTYGVCGALLLVWGMVTVRSQRSARRDWLALAVIAALSMLPVYHRQHDTRLLLLMFPAFAMVWAEGGGLRWPALAVTGAGTVLTGDMAMKLLAVLAYRWHLGGGGWWAKLLDAALIRPAPIVLLAISVFYLWVYARYVQTQRAAGGAEADSMLPVSSGTS